MIAYLNASKIEDIKKFKKEYPKVYDFIKSFVKRKKKHLSEFNTFIRTKDKLSHEQMLELGYNGEYLTSPSFGSKWFYHLNRVPEFGKTIMYAEIFQYIWDND